MRVIRETRASDTGNVITGAAVSVMTWPGLSPVVNGVTGNDGTVELSSQGLPGETRTRSDRGGITHDDYSQTIYPTSMFDLDNLRSRWIRHGVEDGVIVYGDLFRPTGSTLTTIGPGAVVIDGLVAVFPDATTITATNGDRLLVAVRTGDAVALAEIAYDDYDSDTQLPLWRYTISGGVLGAAVSQFRFAGPWKGGKTIHGESRVNAGSTVNASGEVTPMTVSLDLEYGYTYDIEAFAAVIGSGLDGALAVEIDSTLSGYVSLVGDREGTLVRASSKSNVPGGGTALVKAYHRRDTVATSDQWVVDPDVIELGTSDVRQIAVDGSFYIYVADYGNGRVRKYSSAGVYQSDIITGLSQVMGLCIDSLDNIYVTCYIGGDGYKVKKYSSAGVLQWTSATISTVGLQQIATDNTNVYVARANHTVAKLHVSTGVLTIVIGFFGVGNGQFNTPVGVAFRSGTLYVVDQGNKRVQRFNASGVYLGQWGSSGSGDGQFNTPWSITTNPVTGNVYVSDIGRDDVQEFTSTGTFVRRFGSSGSGVGEFSSCQGIVVVDEEIIWATDADQETLQKFTLETADSPFAWEGGLLTARAIPR